MMAGSVALTDKQQAFIEHYLRSWDGAKAARHVSPQAKRPDQIAYEYLRKPEIQAEIQTRLADLKMSADEVLLRLTDQARGSIADFIDVSASSGDLSGAADMQDAKAIVGGWQLNLQKAERAGKLHLIKKLKSGQWGPEIELHDPQAALTLLGRHHGLFVDRTETTIDILGDAAAALDRKLTAIAAAEPPPDAAGQPDDGGEGRAAV
jgi:hypothetical protein